MRGSSPCMTSRRFRQLAEVAANQNSKLDCRGAVEARRRLRAPKNARSAIGVRLSPRSLRQAPRAWARAFSREPRDPGLPFRPEPGKISMSHASDNKNPPEQLAREGPC